MKTVNIQLTERQLAYCYDLLKNENVDRFLNTAVSIKTAVKSNIGNSDVILSVEVEADIIGVIYEKAAMLPEGYATVMNKEISEALLPQLMPYAVQEGTAKAIAEAVAADINGSLEEGQTPVTPAYVDMSVTNVLNRIQAIATVYYTQRETNIAQAIERLKA